MQAEDALNASLTGIFDQAIAQGRVVGAVCAVAHQGKLSHISAHGFADREKQRPMLPTTGFRLSSVTKPIVTLAALRLVAAGILELDAPVTQWLPDFTPTGPQGEAVSITLHQLLTHTSGLGYGFNQDSDGPYLSAGISDGLDHVDFDLAENLRRLSSVPLLFRPGESWAYSLGMDVMGAVIEKATGKSLPQAVAELVAMPLGMSHSGFVTAGLDNIAVAYANSEQGPVIIGENEKVPLPEGFGGSVRFSPSRVADSQAYPSGGAGMYGCAPDMLSFLEALRTGAGLLPASLQSAIYQAHCGPEAECAGPGWGFGYGGAVLVDPQATKTPQSPGTLSWGGVYGHNWFIDRHNDLTVVLMTNTAYEGMCGLLTLEVRDAVYAALNAGYISAA